MGCCTVEGTNKIFSRQARRYAKQFRRRGLDRAQNVILKELTGVGVQGSSILEVGCGVGGLHISLLKNGALSAIGVEISERMIEEAQELAREAGVADRVDYVCGDLVSTNGEASIADIVILDKVLCCYADPGTLIKTSTTKAARLYAVSYPRNALFTRIGFTLVEWMGTMFHWSFHPFYHRPEWLDAAIKNQGFQEIAASSTPIWQVKLFRRNGCVGAKG